MQEDPSILRVALYITGQVQGVGYRVHTRQQAELLKLSGLVKNLPDGRVYVEAQGPKSAVEALIDWCHKGPSLARVDSLEIHPRKPIGEQGFRIIR